MLAIRDKIPSKRIQSPDDLEVVSVAVSFDVTDATFCMVYSPPNATADYHTDLSNYLSTISAQSNPVFLLGDFNLPDINWDTLTGTSTISNNFCDCAFKSNLTQLVESPTHTGGNILDLVLTNSPEYILSLLVHPPEFWCIALLNFFYNFFQVPSTPSKLECVFQLC